MKALHHFFLMWSDEANFTGRMLPDFSGLVGACSATCQAQTTQRMDQFFQWWVVSLAPRRRHSRDMQRSMSQRGKGFLQKIWFLSGFMFWFYLSLRFAFIAQGATWETIPAPSMMFPSRCSYLAHCMATYEQTQLFATSAVHCGWVLVAPFGIFWQLPA